MSDDKESLQQRIRDLEEVHRLAQSLNSIQSVYETLETILDSCVRICQADRGAVLLFSPSLDESVETIVRGRTDSGESTIDHRVNSLVAGWISHHKRSFLTNDVVRELKIPNPSEQVRQLGPALGVPLMIDERMIGIINLVRTKDKHPFAEDCLRTASIIAPIAAGFIHRAKMLTALSDDNLRLHAAAKHNQDLDLILGESPAMKAVRENIGRVASSSATVLLIGETGTGKELVARAIHFQSKRAGKAFIAVNCAAIPSTLFESDLFGHERGSFTGATEQRKGKFELAHEGTLFLDEISAMPLELQPKLLRILEERKFSRVGASMEQTADVRVIAATNRDLLKGVREGTFREDLYHRLNVIPMRMPPLRERVEDIPFLAQTFCDEFSSQTKRFSPEALVIFSKLEWQGNVRELRNVVERITLLTSPSEVTPADLFSLGIGTEAGTTGDLGLLFERLVQTNEANRDLLEAVDRELVHLALKKAGGNISQASRLLGIDRNALQRRMNKYNLFVEKL